VATFIRVMFGTAVYAVIILFARPFPSAAGMLLTFPALNGLAFFFSPASSAQKMAQSMLWMPIINGTLCGIYIVAFLAFGGMVAPIPFSWVSLVIISCLWCAIVTRSFVKEGIPTEKQVQLALAYLLFGIVLTGLTSYGLHRFGVPPNLSWSAHIAISLDSLLQGQNPIKIALFAATFLAFLVGSARIRDERIRGILGGLPVVPFAGLVSVAGYGPDDLAERLRILQGMVTSVWLGPIIGFCFIYGYSKFLSSRKLAATFLDSVLNFLMLVFAWIASGIAILTIAYVISYVGEPGLSPG
jgi:hypothetical protein